MKLMKSVPTLPRFPWVSFEHFLIDFYLWRPSWRPLPLGIAPDSRLHLSYHTTSPLNQVFLQTFMYSLLISLFWVSWGQSCALTSSLSHCGPCSLVCRRHAQVKAWGGAMMGCWRRDLSITWVVGPRNRHSSFHFSIVWFYSFMGRGQQCPHPLSLVLSKTNMNLSSKL